jgi:hypothetical protein
MPGPALGSCSDAAAVRTWIVAFRLAGRESARSHTVVGEAPQRPLEQRLLILRRDVRSVDREQFGRHLVGGQGVIAQARGTCPGIIVTADDLIEETRPRSRDAGLHLAYFPRKLLTGE